MCRNQRKSRSSAHGKSVRQYKKRDGKCKHCITYQHRYNILYSKMHIPHLLYGKPNTIRIILSGGYHLLFNMSINYLLSIY